MTDSTATIEITTSHIWFSIFQDLCSPVIEIDGEPHNGSWGTHIFSVAPGRHEITAYHRWVFFSRAYKSSMSVDATDGEPRRLHWHTGWYVKSPGRWTVS
jgi:hypothetical protein